MSAATAGSAAWPGSDAMAHVGRWVLGQFRAVGEWVLLGRDALTYVGRRQVARPLVVAQIDAVGIGSLPLAALTVAFSSMVLALYLTDQFKQYGFQDYLGKLIGLGVYREMGPVVTAIVVAARQGSAFAAEISTMKVTEQIDALRSLATDPVQHLVTPRLVAMLVAVPLLTVVASTVGVVGGAFVTGAKGVPQEVFWGAVWRGVEVQHFLTGVLKAVVFGATIAVVSCHQGLRCGHGAQAVGRATTASVVLCILVVHILDFAMAVVTQ